MCVENPLSLDKCIILISTDRNNPERWYIKTSNSGRTIGKSYSSITPQALRRHAMQAVRNKLAEVRFLSLIIAEVR